MQLSENFYLSEFVRSQTALRRGIDNTPSKPVIENLRLLSLNVLQPLRDHYNRSVVISSGYRSPALNAAIGGSNKSQHSLGQAADFEIPGLPNLEVANWIKSNLPFDQLILEYYTGGNTGWIHCSYRPTHNRAQLLTINQHGTFQGFRA